MNSNKKQIKRILLILLFGIFIIFLIYPVIPLGGATGKLGGLYEATGEIWDYEDNGGYSIKGIDYNDTVVGACDDTKDTISFWNVSVSNSLVTNFISSFSIAGSGNTDCKGLLLNDSYNAITTDLVDDKNYDYWMNGTLRSSYPLTNGNNDSYGVDMNDTMIINTDAVGIGVYLRDLNHNYIQFINLSATMKEPRGIKWNGTGWWIIDWNRDKAFFFNTSFGYTGIVIDIDFAGNQHGEGGAIIGNKLLISNDNGALLDGGYYYWLTAQTPTNACSGGSCLFNYTYFLNDISFWENTINGGGRNMIYKANVTNLCNAIASSANINSAYLQLYIKSVTGTPENNVSINYIRDSWNESSLAASITAYTLYNNTNTTSDPNINWSSVTASTYTNVSILTQIKEACNRNELLTLLFQYPNESITTSSAVQNDYQIQFGDASGTINYFFFASREVNQTSNNPTPKIYVNYTEIPPPPTLTFISNSTFNTTITNTNTYIQVHCETSCNTPKIWWNSTRISIPQNYTMIAINSTDFYFSNKVSKRGYYNYSVYVSNSGGAITSLGTLNVIPPFGTVYITQSEHDEQNELTDVQLQSYNIAIDLSPFNRGSLFDQIFNWSKRYVYNDSYGNGLKFQHQLRSDETICAMKNGNCAYLIQYVLANYTNNFTTFGDGIGLHIHLMSFNRTGTAWNQITTFNGTSYGTRTDIQILKDIIAQYTLKQDFFAGSIVNGWLWEDTNYSNYIDSYFPIAFNNYPGNSNTDVVEPIYNIYNWSMAPNEPYYPNNTDYQKRGNNTRLQVPCYPGGMDDTFEASEYLNTQFANAYDYGWNGIACHYDHSYNEPMIDAYDLASQIVNTSGGTTCHDYLGGTKTCLNTTYNGVKWMWSTDLEAVKGYLNKTSDNIAPIITVVTQGDFYIISSNEILLNKPLFSYNTTNGNYSLGDILENGTNQWKINYTNLSISFYKVGGWDASYNFGFVTNDGTNIQTPTSGSPKTVTYPQNITVNYTFLENGAYITAGVTTRNITFYNTTSWYLCTLQGSATYSGSNWIQNCSIPNLAVGTYYNLNVTANTSTSGFKSDTESNALYYSLGYNTTVVNITIPIIINNNLGKKGLFGRIPSLSLVLSQTLNKIFLGFKSLINSFSFNMILERISSIKISVLQSLTFFSLMAKMFLGIRTPLSSLTTSDNVDIDLFAKRIALNSLEMSNKINLDLLSQRINSLQITFFSNTLKYLNGFKILSTNFQFNSILSEKNLFNRINQNSFTITGIMGKQLTGSRLMSQSTNSFGLIGKQLFAKRIKTQDITISNLLSKIFSTFKQTTSSFTTSTSLSKMDLFNRANTLSFTNFGLIGKQLFAKRIKTQDITISNLLSKIFSTFKQTTSSFTTSTSLSKMDLFNRANTLSFTNFGLIGKQLTGSRLMSQSTNSFGLIGKQLFAKRIKTQDITSTSLIQRILSAKRSNVQSFTFTALVNSTRTIFTGTLYYRNISQNFGIFGYANYVKLNVRLASQNINFNTIITKSNNFVRNIIDSILMTFTILTNQFSYVPPNVGQTTGGWNACYYLKDDYTCVPYYVQSECPIGYMGTLAECESYSNNGGRIVVNINNYINAIAKKLSPNHQEIARKIFIMFVLLLILAPNFILIKRRRKKRKITQRW